MKIRIATWNITAARKALSAKAHDYADHEDLDYFAEQLRALNLDIVCIQAAQMNEDDSMAQRLAKLLALPFIDETIGFPSYFDPLDNLNIATLSKLPFTDTTAIKLPKPQFTLISQATNKAVPAYDRYAQVIRFDELSLINLWLEPLHAYGFSYEKDEGALLAAEIDELLSNKLTGPLVFAADFNHPQPATILPKTMQKLNEALPDAPTKLNDKKSDHILYSPEWRKTDSGIIKTQSDHYLCWAELEKST